MVLKLLLIIFAGFAAFGMVYLFGDFCGASFNITTWDLPGRFFVALFGSIAAVRAVIYVAVELPGLSRK